MKPTKISTPGTKTTIRPDIIELAELERAISSATCRDIELNCGSLGKVLFDELCDRCDNNNIKLVSTDIFDTLLLRNNKSEARRYNELSTAIQRELGCQASAADLLVSRYEAMDLAYRATKQVNGTTEADIEDVLICQTRSLGLPSSSINIMLRMEIAYEAENLKPNKPLLEALQVLRERGKTVIATSDTYLNGSAIADIFVMLGIPVEAIDYIFSSADHKVNKRSGTMYPFINAELQFDPASCFHIGDNIDSDYRQARNAGWESFFHPISNSEIYARKECLRSFVEEMARREIDVVPWAKI